MCVCMCVEQGNILFNDALNTFFIYGYMASDMAMVNDYTAREETR